MTVVVRPLGDRNDSAEAIAVVVHTLPTEDLLRTVALVMAVVVYALLPPQVLLRLAQNLAKAINKVAPCLAKDLIVVIGWDLEWRQFGW